jgi:hypothetical protein
MKIYSEFFLRPATGPHMPTFQPPANPRSDENIQTTFGTNLEDLSKLSDRLQFNIPNCRKSCEKNILSTTIAKIQFWRTDSRRESVCLGR